jgi:hypothetical protein
MTRQIVCRACGIKRGAVHPEDQRAGWLRHAVFISCITPPGHGIRINGEFKPMAELHCDLCNATLTGQIAVAITMWRPDRELRLDWESQYGTVLPPEAVELADKLEKDKTK